MAFFRRKKKVQEKPIYIITNKDSYFLAKGELESGSEDTNLQIKVLDGKTDRVVEAEIIQAAPMEEKTSVMLGRIILRRGNLITIEPMRKLGSAVRKNFRMPVHFETYAYFHSGGRAHVESIDLSCGGMAFYSPFAFTVGQEFEIVIPITSEDPLIVNAKILRVVPQDNSLLFCAVQFIGIIDDEEALIQEAVFNAQRESIVLSKQRK